VESYRELSESFTQQVVDQKAQVENLKSALRKLEQKLTEAQAKADLLIAQHRRARAVNKATDAQFVLGNNSKAAAFDRMKRKVAHAEAVSDAKAEIAAANIDDRLMALEKEDRIRAAAGGVEREAWERRRRMSGSKIYRLVPIGMMSLAASSLVIALYAQQPRRFFGWNAAGGFAWTDVLGLVKRGSEISR